MGCLTVRPIATSYWVCCFVATTLFAAAQGQTPTSPPIVRPAPSSGISWPGDSGSTGQSTTNTGTDARNITTRSQLRSETTDTTGTTPPGPRDSESTTATGRTRIDRSRSGRGTEEAATPATAPRTGAAETAAADRGAGRDAASTSTASGSTPQTITGTGGAGGGTTFTKGEVGAVSTSNQGNFEPILEREPAYGDVPDDGEKMSLEGPMSLNEFLSAINMATNWNMLVSPLLQDTQLNFYITETSPRDALEILKFNKIYYEFDEEKKMLQVMTQEEYLEREYGKAKPHEFKVSHADITYVESLINTLLSASGRAITDPRTNNIYVWDTEDNISEMVRLVAELDVPLEKEEFTIEYAELPDIEAVLASAMSPGGSILSDARTGQIFVWDKPVILAQMRSAVERLDQPVESKTFHIAHVNAEDVVDSIEAMLTERGMMQIDPRFNTIIVTDLPTRVERIASVIETLDQPLETRTWVIKYAYLDFIADQIETYIPGEMGQIVLNEDVHQLTVTGLPSRLDEIDALIKVWDIKRKQVLIEAQIVEVGTEIERAFNVNWSYFANVNGSPFAINSGSGADGVAKPSGDGQTGSIGRLPYAVPRYGALQLDSSGAITRPLLEDVNGQTIIDRYMGGDIAVMLDYLDKQQKATILSSPRVTVQDSEEAVFENATRVPYVSGSSYYGGGGYGAYGGGSVTNDPYRYSSSAASRVEFMDVGTILSVLPRITEDSNILLDISAEDSTFTDKNIVVDDLSRTVPEKTVRRADTQVRVNSGDTIVLGGLRRDRASHATTKTPLLGDLPLIGGLFRNPKRETSNSSLLIFITTTIVDESTMPESVMIARADQEVADAQRQGSKNLLDRIRNRANGGLNEIGVSIGQGGHIHCKGENVTLDELRTIFFDAPRNMPVTAVIRKHPHAPLEIINEVTEAAMEAELRIEFDTEIPPIVPSIIEP
jgi:type II secretory pathway component GspD/PulD (secretin)